MYEWDVFVAETVLIFAYDETHASVSNSSLHAWGEIQNMRMYPFYLFIEKEKTHTHRIFDTLSSFFNK